MSNLAIMLSISGATWNFSSDIFLNMDTKIGSEPSFFPGNVEVSDFIKWTQSMQQDMPCSGIWVYMVRKFNHGRFRAPPSEQAH